MQKALGVGGIFFRARDPKGLAQWYRDALGIGVFDDAGNGEPWMTEAGATAFSTHAVDTDYFGSREQQFMVNFRVADLDAMLAQLREQGARIDDEPQAYEGMGKFCWATDPEGNRFEIWQPEAED
jgi:glyoxylase I family protein